MNTIRSEFTQNEESIQELVASLANMELQSELGYRGFNTAGLEKQEVQKSLLRQLLRLEKLCELKKKSLTWESLQLNFQVEFLKSKLILFGIGQNIFFLGLTPRGIQVVVFNPSSHEKWIFETRGQIPQCFNFDSSPLHFVYKHTLYLSYSDTQFHIYALEIPIDFTESQVLEWKLLTLTGDIPPARQSVDGCLYKDSFYISGGLFSQDIQEMNDQSNEDIKPNEVNVVHQLDLTTNNFSLKYNSIDKMETEGLSFPRYATSSSILWRDNLLIFSKDGKELFQFNFQSLDWTKIPIAKTLSTFEPLSQSRFIRVFGDDLCLLRKSDDSQFNSFSVLERDWVIYDTIGRRPINQPDLDEYQTFLLHNSTLYTHLSPTNMLFWINFREKEVRSWTNQAQGDEFKDVSFRVKMDENKYVEIKAHRTILSAKCNFFKQLFRSNLNTTTFVMDQVTPVNFQAIIDFHYGTLDFETRELNLFELFEACKILRQEKFQKVIGDQMLNKINDDTALLLLNLFSREESLSHSKPLVLRYIYKNLNTIAVTDSFPDYCRQNASMIQEIFSTMHVSQQSTTDPGST